MVQFAGPVTINQSPFILYQETGTEEIRWGSYSNTGHTASNGGIVAVGPGSPINVAKDRGIASSGSGPIVAEGSANSSGSGSAAAGGSAAGSGSGGVGAGGRDVGQLSASRHGDTHGSQSTPLIVPIVAGAIGCLGPGIYAELRGQIVVPPNSSLATRLTAWAHYAWEHPTATAISGLGSAVLALVVASRR